MIRVLLADDDPAVLTALNDLLGAEVDIVVIGSAVDGTEALALANELRPDAAVVDFRMPAGGAGLVRSLTDLVPGICVIGLSAQSQEACRQEMLHAGASAYLVKGDRSLDLAGTLREFAPSQSA
jgi:two-component system response regulator DevR